MATIVWDNNESTFNFSVPKSFVAGGNRTIIRPNDKPHNKQSHEHTNKQVEIFEAITCCASHIAHGLADGVFDVLNVSQQNES